MSISVTLNTVLLDTLTDYLIQSSTEHPALHPLLWLFLCLLTQPLLHLRHLSSGPWGFLIFHAHYVRPYLRPVYSKISIWEFQICGITKKRGKKVSLIKARPSLLGLWGVEQHTYHTLSPSPPIAHLGLQS